LTGPVQTSCARTGTANIDASARPTSRAVVRIVIAFLLRELDVPNEQRGEKLYASKDVLVRQLGQMPVR
jgi:hypothetical protein